MRSLITATIIFISFIPQTTIAFESGVQPHALLYLNISFSDSGQVQEQANWGFRLDSVVYAHGTTIQHDRLIDKSALLDFRMNTRGIKGIYISGTDYLQSYRVNRQNQDQGEQTTTDSERSISEVIRSAPVGVYIGVGLGIGLLLGVGD